MRVQLRTRCRTDPSPGRARSRNARSRAGSLKNRLPVRVATMPISPAATPNRCAHSLLVAADDHDGPRAHVLFLADHSSGILAAVVSEDFGRMLEQAGGVAGLAGRHGRRQIDQPLRVDGESAHDFERGRRVFFADRDLAAQAGRDDPLAEYIFGVEQVVTGLLGRQRRLGDSSRRKGRAGSL